VAVSKGLQAGRFVALILLCTLAGRAGDHLLRLQGKVWRVTLEGRVAPFSYPFPVVQMGEAGFGSTEPLPSPDGRWIAFGRDHNLHLLNASSIQERQISRYGRPALGRYTSVEVLATAWSVDNRRILFAVVPGDTFCEDCDEYQIREAPYGFFSYDVTTGAAQRVLLPKTFQFEAWLPDGRFLGTLAQTNPGDQTLLVFRPGAAQGAPLIRPGFSLGQVQVSADGRWAIGQNATGIFKIELTTRSIAPVVSDPAGAHAYQWPAFSYDGDHIAYTRRDRMAAGIPEESLIVDGRTLYSCEGPVSYAWVNDQTVVIGCRDKVTLLAALTR